MVYETYLQFISQTIKGYSQKNKKFLIEDFIKNEIVEENELVHLESYTEGSPSQFVLDRKIERCLNSPNAISVFEEWEYKKDYKYSVLFEITDDDYKKIEEEIDKQIKFQTTNKEFEITSSFIDKFSILNEEQAIYLKYSLKYDAIHPTIENEILLKYPIIIIVYKGINLVEIRYDNIKNIFTYDYKQNSDFYVENLIAVKYQIQNHFDITLIDIDMEAIAHQIKEDENIKLLAVDMRTANGSSAQLDVGHNDSYVLPLLGELKSLINENKDIFDNDPIVKELLDQFIKEKEETSHYPWMVLRWENEIKSRSIDVKFIFDYMGKNYCVLQHLYTTTNIRMEKMDHVTKYIAGRRADLQAE